MAKLKFLFVFLLFFNSLFKIETVKADVFSVDNIKVDETASSATSAKKQAYLIAKEKAVREVLNKIVLKDDKDKVSYLSDSEINRLIKNITVLHEKNSSIRYIATLNISLNPDSVKQFLKNKGAKFVDDKSSYYLIIPVVTEYGREVIWTDNSLNAEFKKLDSKNYLTPWVLPYGDYEDRSVINMHNIENNNVNAFNRILKKYGAADAIVVMLKDSGVLEVKYIEGLKKIRSRVSSYDYKRAAKLALEIIQNKWKERYLTTGKKTKTIIVSIYSLNDWVGIEDLIKRIPEIKKYEIKAMAKDRVQIEAEIRENEEKVIETFENKGLSIKNKGSYWVVKSKGY